MARSGKKEKHPPLRHFLYSLGIHGLIISFILTLPGYSGNLDTFSLQSMSVFLGVLEVREAIYAGVGSESIPEDENIQGLAREETESESSEASAEQAADLQEAAPVEKTGAEGVSRLSEDEKAPAERPGSESGDQIQLLSEEVKETKVKKKPEREKSNPKREKSKPIRAEISRNEKKDIKESLSAAALDLKKMKELAGQNLVTHNGGPDKEAAVRDEPVLGEKAKISTREPLAEEEKGVVPAGPELKGASATEAGHSIREEDGNKTVSKEKTQAKNETVAKSGSLEAGQGPEKSLKSESGATKAAGKTGQDNINRPQIGSGKNDVNASAGAEKKNGKDVLQAKQVGQAGSRNSVPDKGAQNGVNHRGAIDRPGAGRDEGRESLGQRQMAGSRKTELREGRPGENEKLGFGLPKPPPPQLSDIRIEVNFNGGDEKKIAMGLLKKAYPLPGKKPQKKKKEEISYPFERKAEEDGSGVKNVLTVLKAEKGTFTFTIDNRGDGCTARILFRIYEGTTRERVKEYKLAQIHPGVISRFRFILPDALFWDDEDRFSGEIENSLSKTKFHYDTGLVWTEDKED